MEGQDFTAWTGDHVRAWRQRLQLSQEDAAATLKMSKRAYQDIEAKDDTVDYRTVLACIHIEQHPKLTINRRAREESWWKLKVSVRSAEPVIGMLSFKECEALGKALINQPVSVRGAKGDHVTIGTIASFECIIMQPHELLEIL